MPNVPTTVQPEMQEECGFAAILCPHPRLAGDWGQRSLVVQPGACATPCESEEDALLGSEAAAMEHPRK